MDFEPITIPDHILSKGMELHFAPPSVLTPIVISHMEETIPHLIDLCGRLECPERFSPGDPESCPDIDDCVPCKIRMLLKREVKVG